jgi:hypothetical protein
MAYKVISGSNAKYLAASDILIGDMSDINYEFLIFNRPIVLLANNWVRKELPNIGIKCNLEEIHDSIIRSIEKPHEYEKERQFWLEKTHHKADGNSSGRVIDEIMEYVNITNPSFVFLHGDDNVLYDTISPIYREAKCRNIDSQMIGRFSNNNFSTDNVVFIAASNGLLNFDGGYKVHVDHGNKGPGVTHLDSMREQWKQNNYWKKTHLQITEGEVSQERTKIILGPDSHKAVMVGFPRADDYLRLDKPETKIDVCKSLNLDPNLPLITYAPAGIYKYPFKQGGSLNHNVIRKLKRLGKKNDYNILVKLKNKRHNPNLILLKKLINLLRK